MRTQRTLIVLGLALLLLVPWRGATAQTLTTGAIQGVVTDAQTGEALPGVTVVAASPALQGTQAAITDDTGQFKITNLPPGTYELTFLYADLTVRRTGLDVSVN